MYAALIGQINALLYSYILIALLLAAGLYFTFRTRFVQLRMLKEAILILGERPDNRVSISSFQALMLSTASRVGAGNIAGVSTAICLGGPGAVFWMWLIAVIGSASAFVESTLAQIYKKRAHDGSSYGGPAYYIQHALNLRVLAGVFAVFLILTYMGGFNMVAAFNVVSSFTNYDFYSSQTPFYIGGALAALMACSIFGGGKRLAQIASVLVPVMAIIYILVALTAMAAHLDLIPGMFRRIFADAFDLPSIFSGFAGSCLMYGIKRGLYSNEAGVGSAPNAAAAASVSHPVKQGLVQMLSVWIDTLVICSATAFLLLSSGVEPTESLKGIPYVQAALGATFGSGFGNVFITCSLFLFAFTTLLGNYFYAEQNLMYLCGGENHPRLRFCFRAAACLIVFFGAQLEFNVAWDTADVLMGCMALINLPVIVLLCNPACRALAHYTEARVQGKEPIFKAGHIDLLHPTDFWR